MTSEIIVIVLLAVALYILLRHWPETKDARPRQQLNIKKPQEEAGKPSALKSRPAKQWWQRWLEVVLGWGEAIKRAVIKEKESTTEVDESMSTTPEPVLRHSTPIEEEKEENEVETLMTKAESAQRKGDFEGAEKLLVKAVTVDPKNPKVYSKLGVIYLEEGENWDEAEESFRQSLKYDPNSGFAHNNLGLVLYNKDKFTGAAKEFEAAIAIDEKVASRHVNLGLSYMALRQFAKAEAAFKRADRLSSNNNDYQALINEAAEKRRQHQR